MATSRQKRELLGSAAPLGAARPKASQQKAGPLGLTDPVRLEGVPPEDVQFVEAPEFYASGCQVTLVGNDFVMTLTRPRTAMAMLKGEAIQVGTMLPQAYITMSASALKDLSIVIDDVLKQYESDLGPLKTPFMRARAANNKK
ncbi:MAG TPA: hypothetical protein VHZ26_04640 [Caulobacteraceae bacterium]|jgi:hypothetical protein|nr:hypothetical protein [Caulobacteraceae bacterium]